MPISVGLFCLNGLSDMLSIMTPMIVFTYARHVWLLNGDKISQLSSSSHRHTARRRFLGAS